MEETLKAVYQGIIDGDMGTVQEKTQSGIDGGIVISTSKKQCLIFLCVKSLDSELPEFDCRHYI
jgi:hypothetical protein